MNIQTIKFLNKLKNASLFNKEDITVAYSKNILGIVKILYKEGFLQSFKIVAQSNLTSQVRYSLVIRLRYFYDKPILKKLKIISSPSRVIYLNFLDISKLAATKNALFFSTSKGILTLLECKKQQIGGALLFIC
jgi:small subunit ribosomal protein S8